MQGHTIIVSSGDWGVAAQPSLIYETNGCVNPGNTTASAAQVVNGTVFNPQNPATCPYVLLVGATQLNDNDTVLDSESAMNVPEIIEEYGLNFPPGSIPPISFSSSGGFSNYFSRPHYQEDAVNAYFAQHDPGYPYYTINNDVDLQNLTSITTDDGLYNRAGRVTPDVSADGVNFMDYCLGVDGPVYGTSLAAPIWASILTLVNEERTAAGKGPVGFINPTLYQSKFVRNPALYVRAV